MIRRSTQRFPVFMADSRTSPASSLLPLQQRTLRWGFWICALVVLVLSLLPGEKIHMPTTGWDKADHLLAYMAMAALGCLAWPKRVLLVLAALLLFGIVIEGLQAMTGYRSAELRDVVAELIGLAMGFGLAWGVGGLLARRQDQGEGGADVAVVGLSAAAARRSGGAERR
ncbi:VanZ family protein [Piscinibacter sakaiensis]|uniref:VanZ family protein n=1 Tax=Piscinibacter sakaiensis TaxID=1547922 RepID=UPI003AAB6109